jgi:putative DNA primase/helicase
MNNNVEQSAMDALRGAGLEPDPIQWNAGIVRCATTSKPHGKDGAYSAHSDDPASIWWKNWSSGEEGTWTVQHGSKLTAREQKILAARYEEATKARDQERQSRQNEAAIRAKTIFDAAVQCETHPYLTNKGVDAVDRLRVSADMEKYNSLIVPLLDEQNAAVSLQFINPDGTKRFLSGGRKRGCYFPIGGKSADKPLLICEGLATGLSLHECLELPVLVSFDAGNLRPVAELARRRYPDRQIVVCADYDDPTDQVPQAGGVGVKAATDAAIAVGGFIAVPRYNGRKCDWNDLHQKMGAAEVLLQFQTAHKPEPIEMTNSPLKDATAESIGLSCVTAYDFLSMTFPERKMLLAPILPRQGLVMLHAARGIGKTFFSLSIAYAVASGGKVFGRWAAPQPARVLFIDGEMPARTLQERLAALVAGADSEPPEKDYLRILTPDMQAGPMPNLATREGQEAVAPLLEGVELVVLDNLATLARHGRSNDEESWVPVQGWLLELRRRGISVLLVHHQGKGGDQRGTSAKEDILDTVASFKRPKDYHTEQGARFEVHLTKARGICGADAKSFEAQLFSDGQALMWTTKDIEDAELDRLRKLLKDGYSIRDAAKELEISKSAADRLKQKLKAADTPISQGTKFPPLEVLRAH